MVTTPRPTNLSFEDMSLERIPANTSWGRLQGDFRIVESAAGTQLELHDPGRDDRYVIVFADHPPPVGPAMITGQVSPHRATTGNVGTIVADDPVVPPVDEPIWLYLTPAVLAIVIAVGLRLGYPVVRRDRATPTSAGAGAPAPTRPASHRPTASHRPSRSTATGAAGSGASRSPATGRSPARSPSTGSRTCPISRTSRSSSRVGRRRSGSAGRPRSASCDWSGSAGSRPGLEIHAATADLLLSFDERRDRDRFLEARA